MDYFLLLLCSTLLSILAVPLMLHIASRFNFRDHSNERKVHKGTKLCLGGGAIYLAFTVTSMVFLPFDGYNMAVVLGGGTFYFFLGLLDDRKNLPASLKLILELMVTIILVWMGMGAGFFLKNPFGGIGFHPVFMALSIPFSVLWIVGIANAVNIIDGLDALASGIILIACITMSITALINPAVSLSPYLLILIGSVAGYIRYNMYPAKIIMGDSGALFLGYTIAIVSLSSFTNPNQSVFLAIIPIAMAMFVPLFDTLIAIVRRMLNGGKIFSADRDHFHHILLRKGYSHPGAVRIVWGLSAVFGAVSLALSMLIHRQVCLALALFSAIIIWAGFSAANLGLFTKSSKKDPNQVSPSGKADQSSSQL